MPRFVMEGVFLSPFATNGNLVLTTETGVTSYSYSYLDDPEDGAATNFTIAGDYSLTLGGTSIDAADFNIALGDLAWGAGLRTTVLFGLGDEGVFIAGVAGDALPDLTGDKGLYVLSEFFEIIDTEEPGLLSRGPYAPDQTNNLAALFRDDTTGSVIKGTQRDDTLSGKAKDDLIVAQKGDDEVNGKNGADTLMLGRGADTGFGGDGQDLLSGFSGSDRLFGGKGADVLLGMDNNDLLVGGTGADTLNGGFGNDRIEGGKGEDRMTGDFGSDTFVYRNGDGRDVVTDFDKFSDTLRLNDNLWSGNLTAEQVVDQFATKANGTIKFKFGDGDQLILKDYGGLGALDGLIDIV